LLSETLKQELARYAVGEKVRSLRRQQDMRLVELAERSGLSPALLSKIERGNSVPSVPSLCKIAAALDVKLSHFFPKTQAAVAVTRQKDRVRLPELADTKDPAYEFECLNFKVSQPKMHCYVAEFNTTQKPRFHLHEGTEFLYVAKGQLVLSLMDERTTLEEGDSVYFDSGVPHCYRKASSTQCVALIVTCPATQTETMVDEADIKAAQGRKWEKTCRRAG
jgi:transcriptional regulator with XRE-family HTH domain